MRKLTAHESMCEAVVTFLAETGNQDVNSVISMYTSALRKRLKALDLTTCTQQDIINIVGSHQLSTLSCDSCNEHVREAIAYSIGDSEITICKSCLQRSLKILNKVGA